MADHIVKCESCCYDIDLRDITFEHRICNKVINGQRVVAVLYYIVCPMCGHEHKCFYKDSVVNQLLSLGMEYQANQRLDQLWELFENGS